jgi:hypothetical protein
MTVIEHTCDRCARPSADWQVIDECYICADCRAETAADEAEVESLRQQLRGAVDLLRELADEAAKAVCEPARFDQHRLSSVVARARRHLGGQS